MVQLAIWIISIIAVVWVIVVIGVPLLIGSLGVIITARKVLAGVAGFFSLVIATVIGDSSPNQAAGVGAVGLAAIIWSVPNRKSKKSISSEEGLATMEFYDQDDTYAQAVKIVVTSGKVSTYFLQEKLSIGFSKAARYLEVMEEQGIISRSNGVEPRRVLVAAKSK